MYVHILNFKSIFKCLKLVKTILNNSLFKLITNKFWWWGLLHRAGDYNGGGGGEDDIEDGNEGTHHSSSGPIIAIVDQYFIISR